MTSSAAQSGNDTRIVALNDYQVSVFARGTSSYTHPDSIVVDADEDRVYVGYQNNTLPDGSDHKPSTIVEYTVQGKVVQTFSILGHNDGLRIDPATDLLWATVNEDANPMLYVIDPTTGKINSYTFPPAPHGGGYDDLAFAHGKVFIAASNPTLNSAGINTAPAVDEIRLSGSTVVLTPVLMGNATALDTTTNQKVTLNLIDPDSLSVDLAGDIVLANQAGAQLVFLHNPGTANQTVTTIPLGTQVDDTVWASAVEGRLFVVDGTYNAIYTMRTNFIYGKVYTEAPNDSGVASFVGTVDLKTGTITPVAIGFGKPTGLYFVPDA